MNLAQSPHIPAKGSKPGWRDLGWLIPFAARGLSELVRARVQFARFAAKQIPHRNQRSKDNAAVQTEPDARLLARMAYVLPRISNRLPWRSDCLVQAIAGQNWLNTHGISSEIQIGVELPEDGDFGAHAWLVSHGEIVTGGDIERYDLLLSDSRKAPDSKA